MPDAPEVHRIEADDGVIASGLLFFRSFGVPLRSARVEVPAVEVDFFLFPVQFVE